MLAKLFADDTKLYRLILDYYEIRHCLDACKATALNRPSQEVPRSLKIIGNVSLFPKSNFQNFHVPCSQKLVLFPCYLKIFSNVPRKEMSMFRCSPKPLGRPHKTSYVVHNPGILRNSRTLAWPQRVAQRQKRVHIHLPT